MDDESAMRCLCAAVQALLEGEGEVEDGVLRLPAETLDSHDGKAVKVDVESEPGVLVFSLVPYPPEGE